MAKIQVANVLRIADINDYQFTEEFLDYMKNDAECIYQDCALREHIFNIEDVLESATENEIAAAVVSQLEQVKKIVDKRNCGYFRICYV